LCGGRGAGVRGDSLSRGLDESPAPPSPLPGKAGEEGCSSPGLLFGSAGLVAFSSHTDSTGTKVLESKYDAISEKPTASDSGTKSACAAPVIRNDGRKTASTQSIASRRGTAVSALPRRTASAIESVRSICV